MLTSLYIFEIETIIFIAMRKGRKYTKAAGIGPILKSQSDINPSGHLALKVPRSCVNVLAESLKFTLSEFCLKNTPK